MGGLRNYRELDTWQLAMTLVETTYRVTQRLPDKERYGLIAQMQRSEFPFRRTSLKAKHAGRCVSGCTLFESLSGPRPNWKHRPKWPSGSDM